MSYSNATFYVDPASGSDAARTALTGCVASNPSGTITRINKTAHGLTTGAVVDLTLFSTWLNAAWKITVVDADNFDLDGAVWQTTADNNGTVTPRGGSSLADAWNTMTYGTSSSRVQAGDSIRVKKSPDPTLVGNATWTQNSLTVTLPNTVTATVANCDSAWTAATNVTATTTTTRKEGTNAANLAIATAFTTGKAAYFATGTLDLSAYQQISFWFYQNIASTSNNSWSLELCTDTTGDTSVHSIPIPAFGSAFTAGYFAAITVDLGTNMNSAIQSIALYQNIDMAAATIRLDHIIACKASSAADSLTLSSLIGKVDNISWAASTAYSTNDKRCPTTANRKGYQYQATTGGTSGSTEPTWPTDVGGTVTDGSVTWTNIGIMDTWFCVKTISGTTLTLDGQVDSGPTTGLGYHGSTETVATYKCEPYTTPQSGVGPTASGTSSSPITLSGGWDTSSMSSQTGHTWFSGAAGMSDGINTNGSVSWWQFSDFSMARYNWGLDPNSDIALRNCHLVHTTSGGVFSRSVKNVRFTGVAISQSGGNGWSESIGIRTEMIGEGLLIASNSNHGLVGDNASSTIFDIRNANIIRNAGRAVSLTTTSPSKFYGVTFAGSGSTPPFVAADTVFTGCVFSDGLPQVNVNNSRGYLYLHKYNNTANDHRIIMTSTVRIQSATDQRHTASGISWKFMPDSVDFGVMRPLELAVAKIACVSGTPRTVKIWTRRDSTNIHGRLIVKGAQLPGVPEKYVDSDPTVNTWVESSGLTFTPTENGVVEITFQVWDGVGTTNNYWIDDITVT